MDERRVPGASKALLAERPDGSAVLVWPSEAKAAQMKVRRMRARGEEPSRALLAIADARPAPEGMQEPVGSNGSAADEIGKAKALLDAGVITQGEFDRIKARALE